MIKSPSSFLLIVLILSVSVVSGADNTPVSVTITQRTPIETLSSDGSVTGVNEATVGTRLNLVRTDGSRIILQDAQGIRYRIALSSTDYSPTTVASSSATNSASQAAAPAIASPLDSGRGLGSALSDAPPAVQNTIGANSKGRTVGNIERMDDDGEVSYEVETTSKDGAEWDLTVAENGTLLSIDMALTELPSAVQTAVNTQVGSGKLKGVAKQFDDGETTYLAGITAPNGDERDFTFAEDGTLEGGEVSLTELPPAVQTAINTQVGQGKLEGIDKTYDDGEINYEATMTNPAGQERDFTFAEDGTLESEEVSLTDLPPAVQTTINKQVGKNKLTGIDETFSDAETAYEATIATSTGQIIDFTVSDQGNLASREVILTETPPAVQATITQTIGNGTITRIDRTFGTKRPHFEIEGKKDGKSFDFDVGKDGKFLGMEN